MQFDLEIIENYPARLINCHFFSRNKSRKHQEYYEQRLGTFRWNSSNPSCEIHDCYVKNENVHSKGNSRPVKIFISLPTGIRL